jgi:hypothetical protein
MEGGKEKVGGRKERVIEEKNMFKAYYLYEWKCHNETQCFVQLIYANKIEKIIMALNNYAFSILISSIIILSYV